MPIMVNVQIPVKPWFTGKSDNKQLASLRESPKFFTNCVVFFLLLYIEILLQYYTLI